MDDPGRRRQNERPANPANPRYQVQIPSPHGSSLTGATDRYRPAPPTAPHLTPRTLSVASSYSSYYQEPQAAFSTPNMSATAMAYGADYGSDARGQSQGFGSYNAGMMMYNVPQPNPQTPVYDTQQFAQRQQAAMQMMTPDVASTYFSSESGAAATSGLPPTAQTSGAPSGEYQQQNAPINYAGHMSNLNAIPRSQAGVNTAATDGHAQHDAALEERWASYQQQLRSVFQDVKNGSLERASETLLGLSTWLLTQVADLGLVQDDASLHDERIKLWNDFNHAWLALGFQQKQLMGSGQQLSRSQSLMSEETIKKIGDELVRLCDGIERHGLVDYQYGVWEEEIESILEECLDLYESSQEMTADDGPR